MAQLDAYKNGNSFPLATDAAKRTIPPSELGAEDEPSTSIPTRSPAPRGPRFSKLSDAYVKITSRQGPNSTFRQASNSSELSNPSLAGSGSSPATTPRLVRSHNDLYSPGHVSAVPGSVKMGRRASLSSIDGSEELPPKMGCRDNSYPNRSERIELELLNLRTQSNDTTGSTIEGILAQYDAGSAGLKVEHDKTREHRGNLDVPLSEPPQESLPELPLTGIPAISNVRQSKYDPPTSDSSITDSQHLLDADAQGYELEEAGRALVPSPLNISQLHCDVENRRKRQCANANRINPAIYEGDARTKVSLSHQESAGYKMYLKSPIERDISQMLGRLSSNAELSIGTYFSSDAGDNITRQIRPRGQVFNPAWFSRASGEKKLRQIKVVIGRESETDQATQSHSDVQDDIKQGQSDIFSEDGDWVTETTSEVGFPFCNKASPRQLAIEHFKRAGSSLADYSDECNEGTVDRFGSRERIISPKASDEKGSYETKRSNGLNLAVLFPRRHNPLLQDNNNRRAGATQQETDIFHPQVGSRRLVFDFDQNAPPKYEFRDSVSEYDPAEATVKTYFGKCQYGTYGSLPSSEPTIEENYSSIATKAQPDQFTELDAARNRSTPNVLSRQTKNQENPRQIQDRRLSTYATGRQKRLDELELQEFAATSSYYEPPSISSVRSKFNFELLPLGLAQQKNRQQRGCGEADETQSAITEAKQKQTYLCTNTPTLTIARPAKAFLTGRDLSINFSPPNWRTHRADPGVLADTSPPVLMGISGRTGSNVASISRDYNTQGSPEDQSPFGVPSIMRRPYRGQHDHPRPAQFKPPKGFVAPDDYVSDRADRIRSAFFYIIAGLSILPFVGVLALSGAFKEALKWATCSEVDRLTARQRRCIKWLLLVESIIYTSGVVTVVVYFVVKSKVQN